MARTVSGGASASGEAVRAPRLLVRRPPRSPTYSLLRLCLRLHRTAIIGWSLIGLFADFVQIYGFEQIVGHTPEERAAFGSLNQALGVQLSYLAPIPIHPETLGGFAHWRLFSFFPVMLAIWGIAAGVGALRGDEERGLVNAWLSMGVSRRRLIVVRSLAFAIAVTVAMAITGLGAYLVAASGHESFDALGLVEEVIPLIPFAVVCFEISALVSNFAPSPRSAIGASALLVYALILLNNLSRTIDSLKASARITPLFWVDRSDPGVPGGHLDILGLGVMVVMIALLVLLVVVAFRVRDLGSPVFSVPSRPIRLERTPSRNPFFRIPLLEPLYEQRGAFATWVAVIAAMAFFMATSAKGVTQLMGSNPQLKTYLDAAGQGARPEIAYLAIAWFGILQLIVVAMAVFQVARWAAEDGEGRLEMMLSQPISRTRVVIERAITLATMLLAVSVAAWFLTRLALSAAGFELDPGRLWLASLLLVPFGLSFGAVGALAASRWPRAAVATLGTYAGASAMLAQVGHLYKLPDWIIRLSAFQLYGVPLSLGVDRTGLVVLVAVTLVGFGLTILTMQRRDVGR